MSTSRPRWLPALALPLALAATLGTARASSVRDGAGMFSASAVKQAEAELNRVQREHKIATEIETVDTLDGRKIADVSLERTKESGIHGIYILIAKKEHQLYDRVSGQFRDGINADRQRQIREAIESGFKKGDFDSGLLLGVKAIDAAVSEATAERRNVRAAVPPAGRGGMPVRRGNPPAGGGFGLSSLLGLGLLILAVLFGIRLLGRLFSGGAPGGYAGPPRMGQPGYGPGPGPGYGAPAGGGGFMSSLFGGIGGAMAGNWLYDQFSGRRHGEGGGYVDNTTYGGDAAQPSGPNPDDWSSGGGGDWGGGGGGDAGGGGGDWGGGGGGGDWGGGGGGGDGGGGGGDW